MYDPDLGRFTAEDPIGFGGGNTNLFGYVGNNPLNFIDPFGLFPSIWPFDYHQQIGTEALTGWATPRQIQSINWANENFDLQTQDAIYAPLHAMTKPGQRSWEARQEANAFIRNKICTAREYASRGWYTDAMHQLAEAIHTVQDAESPAHRGFQEAWPSNFWSNMRNYPSHLISETFFPGDVNYNRAVENTRKIWGYYKGVPMPKDFFTN